jgi:hypothetical protein
LQSDFHLGERRNLQAKLSIKKEENQTQKNVLAQNFAIY